ncbi:hypothetical protein PT520_09695 [Aliarcobacter butzleri]|uniref:Uncharacterized protein n=1 Tax=Aliarcobacter butzleri TaxID=28197 RepID=A0AAW6VQW0_9BACT|nr:hypothetical protein [Aliarcobacter butzleri]MDK2062789.1 hypothetical protein [Aliarcobacter butzleri]
MEFFTNLFKDGSWLSNAFSGENFGKSLTGLAGIGGAISNFNAANAQKDYNNKLFGLQQDQYNNLLKDQEEEKKRRDKVDDSLASVWG